MFNSETGTKKKDRELFHSDSQAVKDGKRIIPG